MVRCAGVMLWAVAQLPAVFAPPGGVTHTGVGVSSGGGLVLLVWWALRVLYRAGRVLLAVGRTLLGGAAPPMNSRIDAPAR